ncbi:MAG: Stf0 family sulfotransferase [Dongiaceae bacterium]
MNLPRADKATMARIRDYMAEARDLPQTPVRLRYLVLSQPRTGGTFLCEALERSGAAGVPAEYLNPAARMALSRRFGAVRGMSLPRLMEELHRRRTTSNGVFGLHLHLEQLRKPLQTEQRIVEWLGTFDRIIFLYRRDKLAQAVSLDRALQTSRWFQSAGTESSSAPVEMRPAGLAGHIMRLFEQEAVLREHVHAIGRPVLELDYESLDNDFMAVWPKVTAFLGILPVPADAVLPELQRMRDAASEKIAEQFAAALRDSDLLRTPS